MFTTEKDVTFDDFTVTRLDIANPVAPRWSSTAKATLVSNKLKVEAIKYGGTSVLDWAGDDAYIAQVDIDLNTSGEASILFRYADPDNYYAARIGEDTGGSSGPVELVQVVRGKESVLSSSTYTTDTTVTLKVKVESDDDVEIWVDGTSEITYTSGLEVEAGGVALEAEAASFDNVQVGYDTGVDDAIDDYVVNETFSATTVGFTYDANGNTTFDGTFKYTYDAWNNLVKATLDDTDITIQTAEFDGVGRRFKKIVTKTGVHDVTKAYYHNRSQIIETRDGSDNLLMQVIHGTRYVDEIICLKLEHGRVYVHQDANYNVTGITDLTGRLLERNYQSPYGQPSVITEAHFFDWDDDGDVDATDVAAATTGGDCWGDYSGDCQRLDADSDRDIDANDYTAINNYVNTLTTDTEIQRIPVSTFSRLGNPFAHQGLVFDAAVRSYQNRARQYAPKAKRFLQRDPLVSVSTGAGQEFEDGLSLYAYVGNHPLAYTDPLGAARRCGTAYCDCPGVSEFPGRPNWLLPSGWIFYIPVVSTGRSWVNPFAFRIEAQNGCCDVNDVHAAYAFGASTEHCRDRNWGNTIDTVKHECIHICQIRREGAWSFAWNYFWRNLRCGWACNPYEIEAAALDCTGNSSVYSPRSASCLTPPDDDIDPSDDDVLMTQPALIVE